MDIGVHVFGGCFSQDGSLFSSLNEQGVLRVWNTETNELKQEFTPNLHLFGQCTAIAWISSKKSEKNATPYLALGTNTGGIALYSHVLGKVDRTFSGEGHNGKINGIVHDKKDGLFTCGDDGQIIMWSLRKQERLSSWSAGKERLCTLCYMPNSQNLVVGGRKIKVFSTGSKEVLQTFSGHSAEVVVMTSFTVDGKDYFITASNTERIACVWKVSKKSQIQTAISTLLMEDVVNCLSVFVNAQSEIQIISVTRNGAIHVFVITCDVMKKNKPIKPKVTIKIASDSHQVVEPLTAIAARAEPNDSSPKFCFGYGSNTFVVFERIEPEMSEKLKILIRSKPTSFKKKNQHKKEETSAVKTLEPQVNPQKVDYKHSMLIATKKNLKPVEMPMESRLQNLNHVELNGKEVNTQSKVQLLLQALHSKDRALLHTVLSTYDLKTIQMTVQRLPVQYVDALVNELTRIIQSKQNVMYSLNWFKVLAQTHSSQLMALGADDLLFKFGVCIGIIEHRANCLTELSKLNGRLQLLVNQIRRNIDDDFLENKDMVVYEDSDSSNSDQEENNDLEENGIANASDSNWEEGESDEQEPMEEDDIL